MQLRTNTSTKLHADFIGAGFLKDLLEQFDASYPIHRPLFNIALCYDLSCPANPLPFSAYRDAIDWIVLTYGEGYLLELGKRIGQTELLSMYEYGLIGEQPEAEEICNALSMVVAHTNGACGSQGLQLIGADDKALLLQLDFPFNRLLMEGLLFGLMEAAGYTGVDIIRTQPSILELTWKRRKSVTLNHLYDEPGVTLETSSALQSK